MSISECVNTYQALDGSALFLYYKFNDPDAYTQFGGLHDRTLPNVLISERMVGFDKEGWTLKQPGRTKSVEDWTITFDMVLAQFETMRQAALDRKVFSLRAVVEEGQRPAATVCAFLKQVPLLGQTWPEDGIATATCVFAITCRPKWENLGA